MEIRQLHQWNLSYADAVALQTELSKSVVLSKRSSPPTLIAGADVSYSKPHDRLFAGVIVFEVPSLAMVEKSSAILSADFPYIPGLLTFREAPALLEAFRQLESQPDVVIFDGQGIAHPRGMGLATHLGLWLEVSTIGCAKKRLIGEHGKVGDFNGASAALVYDDKRVGFVVRTRMHVKPVFVSPGHLIDFDESVEIVLQTTRGYRLPEPTRQAHLFVNQLRTNGCS